MFLLTCSASRSCRNFTLSRRKLLWWCSAICSGWWALSCDVGQCNAYSRADISCQGPLGQAWAVQFILFCLLSSGIYGPARSALEAVIQVCRRHEWDLILNSWNFPVLYSCIHCQLFTCFVGLALRYPNRGAAPPVLPHLCRKSAYTISV